LVNRESAIARSFGEVDARTKHDLKIMTLGMHPRPLAKPITGHLHRVGCNDHSYHTLIHLGRNRTFKCYDRNAPFHCVITC
jgi:hypothetical protein